MTKQQMIQFVLEYGNASQKYMIMRDVLNIDKSNKEMLLLQSDIIQLKAVKKMLNSQNEDGWFGNELHGGPMKAMDSTVIYLTEIGLEPTNSYLRKAKKALLANANPDLKSGKVRLGFDRGYNYSNSVILAALHLDGEELENELKDAYTRIMELFEEGAKVTSLDEISKECTKSKYIGQRVFLDGKFFPWISDISVLARSNAWVNPMNKEIVQNAMKTVGTLMPIPNILEPFHGYYLGTIGNYLSLSLNDPLQLPKGDIVWWIRDIQNLCRITDITHIPHFYNQVTMFKEYVINNTLITSLSKDALKAFENFYGYYNKWKNEIQVKTDIYYQALMILHLAGLDF